MKMNGMRVLLQNLDTVICTLGTFTACTASTCLFRNMHKAASDVLTCKGICMVLRQQLQCWLGQATM